MSRLTSVTSPREGLPPCIKGLALSDERAAVWTVPCWHGEFWAEMVQEYGSLSAVILPYTEHLVRSGPRYGKKSWHGLPVHLRSSDARTTYAGDDPDEAAAAFERGREYVLTGVLT